MTTLVNLVNNNGIIDTDYFGETNESDKGHIQYDIRENKVIDYSYSNEDAESPIKIDFRKAIRAIELLIQYNKFPEKYSYIWY